MIVAAPRLSWAWPRASSSMIAGAISPIARRGVMSSASWRTCSVAAADLIVRPGGPEDVEEAVAIFALCGLAQHPDRPTPEARVEEVRATLLSPSTWLLIAQSDGVQLGFAASMPSREDQGSGPVVPGLCYLDLIF